jgi:heme exporter protein D
MTTEIDHTPYLDMQDDPLHFWQQRIKASRWMIVKTIALGTLAAVLGVLGQGWLEDAAPLFPFISQNYGVWQAGYLLSLIVIFLLWAAALLQKIGLLQNSRQGLNMQQRIDEQNERREERKRAARERREQERLERETAPSFFKQSARGNKFDY